MNTLRRMVVCALLFTAVIATGCKQLDVYEKTVPIPGNKWSYSFKPSFDFNISDTTIDYNVYVVIRHLDGYGYNNVWLNIGTATPTDSIRYQKVDLLLGDDRNGWEGTGMDNIWEVRKSITNGPIKFSKKGHYSFSLAHIMREDPLPGIMNVGVRVERAH